MDKEEAKRRHKKAPLLLLLRRFFAVAVGFLATITIARLLGPHAYGLANMSGIILALAQVFRDFGVTQALMRKGQISVEERTVLFWFNAATSTGIAILLACLAPWAAAFYKEPVVGSIMLVSAFSFWLGGMSLQHRSLLLRAMRFGDIAWIDAAGVVVNFAVALTIALIRRDVWAIVFGALAQQLTTSILSVWRSGFVPGRPRKMEGFGELLKFGANTSIFAISWFVSNNIAPLLIGHQMGAAQLGQYNRAQALYALPSQNLVQPIAQATLPLLTHLRPDPEAYREAYLRLTRTLTTFMMPAAVFLGFAGEPLALTLLGDQWAEAGWVLTCLAPTLAMVGMIHSLNDLFITQNRSSEMRNLGLIEMTIRIVAIAVGAMFGLVGVSIAFTASSVVAGAMRVFVAGRSGPVSAVDQFRQFVPALPMSIMIALACGATLVGFRFYPLHPASELAALMAAAVVGAVLSLAIFRTSRTALLELLQTFGLPAGLRQRLGKRFSKQISDQKAPPSGEG